MTKSGRNREALEMFLAPLIILPFEEAERPGYQQQPRICQGYWLGLGEFGSTELKPWVA